MAYRTGGAKSARRLSLLRSPSGPSLRFSSPLIEPDERISRTRLSEARGPVGLPFHECLLAGKRGKESTRLMTLEHGVHIQRPSRACWAA